MTLSVQNKKIVWALLAALLTVRSAGVEMKGTFLEFDDGLRRHLMRNPELQSKVLTDSLADYVYESQPASRPKLDELRGRALDAADKIN